MRLHGFEQHSVRVKSLIMLHMQYGERGMVGRGVWQGEGLLQLLFMVMEQTLA